MSGPLEGRAIALAGAAGALGPHVARALLEAGAAVALADADGERLTSLVHELDGGERVAADVVDLLDPAGAAAWASAASERFGTVDGLVHAVGGWRGGRPLAQAPPDDWAALEGLLVRTAMNASRAFRDLLLESGRGRFVLISAKQARRPTGANAAYAAAKAAAEAWTAALADDFRAAGGGATANVVAINALVTPQMRAEAPEKPFRAFTDAGEVADAIVWLCSERARKVNGQRISLYDEAS